MENSRVSKAISEVETKEVLEMQGQLKHIKSFWSSARDLYRLRYPHLLIARGDGNATTKFEIAYDLRVYRVTLGSDEQKLLLIPKDVKFNAQKVEFVADSSAER